MRHLDPLDSLMRSGCPAPLGRDSTATFRLANCIINPGIAENEKANPFSRKVQAGIVMQEIFSDCVKKTFLTPQRNDSVGWPTIHGGFVPVPQRSRWD